MTPHLAYEEETLWRNLHAPRSAVPFIECADAMLCIRRYSRPPGEHTLQPIVARLIERHAVLRSRFPAEGDGAIRESVPVPRHPVGVFDVSELPPHLRQALAARVVHAGLCASFDIAAGPLVRAAWITLDPQQHILALAAHHMVFDVPSARIVSRELDACIADPATVLPPTASYSDYVLAQRKQLAGAAFERLRSFWLRRLDGLLDRRFAIPKAHAEEARSKAVAFTIDEGDARALRQCSKRSRVSMATTILGLLAIVLHEMTDSPDVVIGVPVSCRPAKGYEHTVGLFINVVPVRSSLSEAADFSAFVGRLWSSVIDSYQHRAFPYECLVDALGARRGQGPPPLRVVFNYSVPSSIDLASSEFPDPDRSSRRGPPSFADLSLHARDTGTAVEGAVMYRADLFDEASIGDLTTRLRRLTREVVHNSGRSVGRFVHS